MYFSLNYYSYCKKKVKMINELIKYYLISNRYIIYFILKQNLLYCDTCLQIYSISEKKKISHIWWIDGEQLDTRWWEVTARNLPDQKRNRKTDWRSATYSNKEALFTIKNGERISINASIWWIKIIIDVINTYKYI